MYQGERGYLGDFQKDKLNLLQKVWSHPFTFSNERLTDSSTEYCPKILTPALLTRFKKRFYPTYTHSRRKDIWASREALIEFEEALALEAKLDSIDGYGSGAGLSRGRSVVSKTPARGFKTPGTPASIAKGKGKENVSLGVGADDPGSEEGPAVQKARLLKEIFEVAYPKWQEMVAVKGHEEGRAAGLERFDGGKSCHNLLISTGTLAEVRYV